MNSRYTLKDLRKNSGLTIERLSEQTKISVDTLILIESDSGQAEWCDIATLSKLYRISPDYIYIGKQSEDDANIRSLGDALTADIGLGYDLSERLRIDLRGENIFNARVEAAISSTGIIERANPRTLWLGVRYNFD